MAKVIFNIGNGALVLSEQGGDFTLALSDQVAVGGGAASGIVSAQGSGSIVLHGKQAFDLGMALLEAHSPAAVVPLEEAVQGIADAAISQQ